MIFTLAGAVVVSLCASLHPAARAVRADAAESIPTTSRGAQQPFGAEPGKSTGTQLTMAALSPSHVVCSS